MDGAKRLAMVETKTISGGAAVTPLVSMFRYQLGNHLGSAVLEVDAAGLIISYEEYSPYGSSAYRSSRSGVDVSARRYRYVGLERDNETGLYSMGARYYAAWLGRWTSADPLGIGADGPGIYNYTWGSPVMYVDPGGMDSEVYLGNATDASSTARFDKVWGENTREWRDTKDSSTTGWYVKTQGSKVLPAPRPAPEKGDFDATARAWLGSSLPHSNSWLPGWRDELNMFLDEAEPALAERRLADVSVDLEKGAGKLNAIARSEIESLLWSPEAEANYQRTRTDPRMQRVGPPPEVDLVGPIVSQTPAISFSLWSTFVGTLPSRTAPAIPMPLRTASIDLQTASQSAAEAYKGSTRLGHAFSKHAGRNPEIWGTTTGHANKWHDQGLRHFQEIVDGPGHFQQVTDSKTGILWIEKRLPDGRGIRLNRDYTFKGFVD